MVELVVADRCADIAFGVQDCCGERWRAWVDRRWHNLLAVVVKTSSCESCGREVGS